MLSVVKISLKGVVGGCALNSHGNYIVDHGKSWNCVCGTPAAQLMYCIHLKHMYFDTFLMHHKTCRMKKANKQCLLDTPRTVRVREKTCQVIVQTSRL